VRDRIAGADELAEPVALGADEIVLRAAGIAPAGGRFGLEEAADFDSQGF